MTCGSNDPLYPIQADIFYPEISQSAYGSAVKKWSKDVTVYCSLGAAGSKFKEGLSPNVDISIESLLIGRLKSDPRITNDGKLSSMTNVIISNIKDKNCNEIYLETSGTRKNQSTIFELATVTPHVGPFGTVDYYRVILRRSENQGTEV
jgi:hypothetical protein